MGWYQLLANANPLGGGGRDSFRCLAGPLGVRPNVFSRPPAPFVSLFGSSRTLDRSLVLIDGLEGKTDCAPPRATSLVLVHLHFVVIARGVTQSSVTSQLTSSRLPFYLLWHLSCVELMAVTSSQSPESSPSTLVPRLFRHPRWDVATLTSSSMGCRLSSRYPVRESGGASVGAPPLPPPGATGLRGVLPPLLTFSHS